MDWFIFSLGAALLGAVVLPIVAFPEVSESAINLAFGLITQELGVIYVALATTILVFLLYTCLLYTSPSPRDKRQSRMPSSA